MNDHIVERIRRGLDGLNEGLDARSEAEQVMTQIAGRTPRQMDDAQQTRILRRLSLAAALVLVGLGAFALGHLQNARPTDLELPALVTLEEDGYGTYSTPDLVLADLLIGENPE